jgi:adenine nucleotide transporter 17
MISTLKEIVNKDGVLGLYRGLESTVFGTVVTQFTYFYFYALFRNAFARRLETQGRQMGIAFELGVGMLAGAISRLFTTPISVVTTRQQVDGGGFFEVLREVVSEGGYKALYKGLRANLVLTINPSITYGVFERLKTIVLRKRLYAMLEATDLNDEEFTTLADEYQGEQISVTTTPTDLLLDPMVSLTSWEIFCIGALSKSLATIVSYPYILARVKLQAKSKLDKPYKSAIDVLKRTYESEGVSGWYRGIYAQLVKSVATQVILFLVKDKFEDGLVALLRYYFYGRTRSLGRSLLVDGQAVGK